jgi:hypothetical protein
MSPKLMLPTMVKEIRFRGGTEDQIGAYLFEWNNANEHPGMPMPCPVCFLKGEIQRLNPLQEGGRTGIVRCARCCQYFEFDGSEYPSIDI